MHLLVAAEWIENNGTKPDENGLIRDSTNHGLRQISSSARMSAQSRLVSPHPSTPIPPHHLDRADACINALFEGSSCAQFRQALTAVLSSTHNTFVSSINQSMMMISSSPAPFLYSRRAICFVSCEPVLFMEASQGARVVIHACADRIILGVGNETRFSVSVLLAHVAKAQFPDNAVVCCVKNSTAPTVIAATSFRSLVCSWQRKYDIFCINRCQTLNMHLLTSN